MFGGPFVSTKIGVRKRTVLALQFGKGERTVQVNHVKSAAEDTEGVEVPSFNYMPAVVAVGGLVVGAVLVFYLGQFYL